MLDRLQLSEHRLDSSKHHSSLFNYDVFEVLDHLCLVSLLFFDGFGHLQVGVFEF